MWSRVRLVGLRTSRRSASPTCSSATEPTERERAVAQQRRRRLGASHTLAGAPERSNRSCSRTASMEKAAPSSSEIDQKRPPPKKSKAWRTARSGCAATPGRRRRRSSRRACEADDEGAQREQVGVEDEHHEGVGAAREVLSRANYMHSDAASQGGGQQGCGAANHAQRQARPPVVLDCAAAGCRVRQPRHDVAVVVELVAEHTAVARSGRRRRPRVPAETQREQPQRAIVRAQFCGVTRRALQILRRRASGVGLESTAKSRQHGRGERDRWRATESDPSTRAAALEGKKRRLSSNFGRRSPPR